MSTTIKSIVFPNRNTLTIENNGGNNVFIIVRIGSEPLRLINVNTNELRRALIAEGIDTSIDQNEVTRIADALAVTTDPIALWLAGVRA